MDNASKALLIAGGVLIAILVIAIGVQLIGSLSSATDSYVTKLDVVELQKYNSNFEIYLGRRDITAQEIITVVNVAQELKKTKVYLESNDITNYNSNKKNEFLADSIVNQYQYKCTYDDNTDIYDQEGKVIKIIFKKN